MIQNKITTHKHSSENYTPHARRTIIWRYIIALCIGLLFQTTPLLAAVSADKIKAAYIYQLSQFVTWPDASVNTDFTICTLGKEPINEELAPLNKRKNGMRTINIRTPKEILNFDGCHILYIAKSEQHRLQTILKKTYQKPILTVSSIPDFAANGGGIGFTIIKNKVRLEINRGPAHRANIKLSAKLLEVAHVITSDMSGETQP